MINPAVVTNAFLYLSAEEHIPVTHLKLQQLVYCYYREMLHKEKQKVFEEPFIKGEDGPELRSLSYEYKCVGNNNVDTLWKDAVGQSEMIDVRAKGFSSVRHLYCIWNSYKKIPTRMIKEVLTERGSAWDRADNILSDKDIALEPLKRIMIRKGCERE